MGLPGCLFVCHLILLLMCFLFNSRSRSLTSGLIGILQSMRKYEQNLDTSGAEGFQETPVIQDYVGMKLNEMK